jgi:hypothetical protein
VAEHRPLGVGDASILVPDGWEPVRVDAAVVGLTDGDLAAGVAEVGRSRLGANVMLYRVGPSGIASTPERVPDSWVLHDGTSDDGRQRVHTRFAEVAGIPMTQLLVWFVLGDEHLLLQATWESGDLARLADDIVAVVGSVVPPSDAWVGWFG